MASIELNQYKDVIFPNLDVSQKAIVDILEAFRHLKESHIKISGRNNDVKKLDKSSSKFNDLVVRIAKGSLKKSMDLEDFTEYFKMLTEDNVTSNDLLQTLLVLKDMAKQRISDSEELKNDFEQFKTSIAENISQSSKSFGDSDVELVQRNQLLQITDGSQPPNFLNALAQFLPEVFMLVFTLVSTYSLLSWILPEMDFLKNIIVLVVTFGYCAYYHKRISRKWNHLTGFYKRNNNTIMNDEKTLVQFWKQQYDIFESHINVLRSMDGNVNLSLPKKLTVGIIERCTAEEINCKEFHQMLNDSAFKNAFIRLN
nr:14851_t:CDS:2 [Entrophospora candida]